ncbi:MAG: ornithine carbamoyltransferase [Candidatus Melainabacteria bacterium RIFCSPHIGHO2_02_FULL_34_12]|nr:MAG: ornithine carbamoyltransferase [Candidatus Melainabacteria bacterium RIFCSPHIGHO2_02_FULL_34_12]
MPEIKTKKTDLISIADITSDWLQELLSLTKNIKSNPHLKSDALSGKSIALIFAKPSLRTRVSFEVGINQLGGQPVTIKMDEISVGTRENVEDIANVLSRYVSGIVIRTFEHKQVEELGKYSLVPVINGLSDEEHPCQIISDLFTITEIFKDLNGLKLTYVGDGNNVAHSLLLGCALANINISIATPKNYEPSEEFILTARKLNPKIKIEITNDAHAAAKNAHILYTDVWASMGQEKEAEKRKKDFAPYQINNELVSHADKNAVVLHCLPAHKEQEISASVFDKYSKFIYRQAENRLHAQKAILLKLICEK